MLSPLVQRIISVLLTLQIIAATAGLIIFSTLIYSPVILIGLSIALSFFCFCLFMHLKYHWKYVPHVNTITTILIISFILIEPADITIATIIFLPAALSVIMLTSGWTVLAGIATYGLIFVRVEPDSPYRSTEHIISYVLIIACLYAGRRIIEQSQTETLHALQDTQHSRDKLQALVTQTQAQATELAQRNEQQTELLALVSELELPLVPVGPQTLLVPLIGNLDSRRMHTITQRLLYAVNQSFVTHIILDVSGVQVIDTRLVEQLTKLVQALRLLGAMVVLSGISAQVATTLATQQVNLKGVTIVRSAYDALQHIQSGFAKTGI